MLINLEDKLKGVTPQGNCDKGIRKFVRSHFEQISRVRAKGYSWKQIADTVQAVLHLKSRNLKHSLNAAYYLVSIERENK